MPLDYSTFFRAADPEDGLARTKRAALLASGGLCPGSKDGGGLCRRSSLRVSAPSSTSSI
jgi:hypothetical protein